MRRSTVLAAALVASLVPGVSSAGGFFLTDRGVRPLGRGGAFVAGADDGHAIWYNPAGLSEAGNGLLLDASLVLFSNTYTRAAQPVANGPTVTFRPTDGSSAPLPIPTLVFTHDFGLRNFRFAAGVYAPNAALTTYDTSATAPQRYSLLTLDGSLLAQAGVWVSWKPHPIVSIGAGFQVLAGTFQSQLAFSACPATILCTPENPDWDSLAQLSAPILAPTGSFGVRVNPHAMVSVGASFNLPTWVSADASLKVRLPSASYFDGARVEGEAARVDFMFPAIARVGVEVRPTPRTRVELAGVWEGWSVHDQIRLSPQGIRITNVRGIGTYDVGNVALDRRFVDVWSVRLGGEQGFELGSNLLTVRAGFSYETSATPAAYTNVLTFDAAKSTVSLGASLSRGRLRLDAVFAHTFWGPVETTPCAYDPAAPTRCQGLYPTAPFRTGPNAPRYTVNGGTYDPSLNVVGLGAQYQF
jgi:long-chain fatty acid transport protein